MQHTLFIRVNLIQTDFHLFHCNQSRKVYEIRLGTFEHIVYIKQKKNRFNLSLTRAI